MKTVRTPADKFTILDPSTERTVDLITMVLIYYNRHSVLPEIVEVFGAELTMKFLDIFGGTTVKVPSRDSLHTSVRDVNIYLRLKSKSDTVDDLAHDYQLDKLDIKRIFVATKKIVESRLGLKVVNPEGTELDDLDFPEVHESKDTSSPEVSPDDLEEE